MTSQAESSTSPFPATPALEPGFMVIQGNRLEALRQLLVQWTHHHPLSPLENELILVQSNGIAQWLKLALAADTSDHGGIGIAAALDVRLPGRFLWQAYRAVLGHELPDQSPYDKEPLTWRLMRLLPDLLAEPVFSPLQRFLADDDGQRKQHQLAEQLADLLDQYQVYRSDWLTQWAEGNDALPEPGLATQDWPSVPDDQRWQPALWRRIKADINATVSGDTRSRAQVHQDFMTAAHVLTPDTRPRHLPRRIIVFGLSSLPQQTLDVLSALSGCSQIILCVHNPCQHYWGDIIEGHRLFSRPYQRTDTKPGTPAPDLADAASLHAHAHPLLAAWGRQGRDYIRLLDEHDERQQYEALFQRQNLSVDLFESPVTETGSQGLLQQLQDDILNLRPLPETRTQWPPVDPEADRSLVFHRAHGPQREVEILHDQLRAAFDADATLNPRDILVMVPDIDVYAPHVRAVFGQLERNDPRFIPFTLSDQGQRHQNPLVIALESLLHADQSRFTVSDLLDLLDVPAVRARFALNEDDVAQLHHWIEGANIRWGLHQAHRNALGLGASGDTNTWQFGLRRMLLGYASNQPWLGMEPYDEMGGLSAALAGPLAQLIETLDHHWRALTENQPPTAWAATLNRMRQDLFAPQSEQDTLLLSQLDDVTERWISACEQANLGTPLPLSVVRETLLSQLDTPGLTQRFMGGAVNFATLMPMRAIPFRKICLLGMNDGDYPRQVQRSDFDLMQPGATGRASVQQRPGDRSRREDDRYLFLEALLSARDQLYISWVGNNIRDNSARPPSVLAGQLRDHINAGWRCRDTTPEADNDTSVATALTTQHPLQPFSTDYFIPDGASEVFTYAQDWRRAHDEPQTATEADPGLPFWLPEHPVTLHQLGNLLRQPVDTFFQIRLGSRFQQEDATGQDDEAFRLDSLDTWQAQHELLTRTRQHIELSPPNHPVTVETALANEWQRLARAGNLPLPPFDTMAGEALAQPLEAPLSAYQALLNQWHRSLAPQEISLILQPQAAPAESDATLVLEDWLDDIRQNDQGDCLRLVLQTSNLYQGNGYKWHHLARQWPRHLAAQMIQPMPTRLLGPETDLTLEPLPSEVARGHLETLLEHWAAALQAPLPLACATGFAELSPGGKPATTYDGGFKMSGDVDRSPATRRCWPDYAALNAEPDYPRLIADLYQPLYELLKGPIESGDDSGSPS